MKKAIVGFAAVGAVVGLLVAVRRITREMHEHSKQMKAHCKQMAAHCKEMMASRNGSDEMPSEVEEMSKKQPAAAPDGVARGRDGRTSDATWIPRSYCRQPLRRRPARRTR